MTLSRAFWSLCLALPLTLSLAADESDCEKVTAVAAADSPAAPAEAQSAPQNPRARRQQRQAARQPLAAQSQPATPRARAGRGRGEPAGEAMPEGSGPAGTRLTDEQLYDTQPAVLPRADGGNWVAWVGYQPGGGDYLLVGIERSGKLEKGQQLTDQPGDLFRPVLVRSGETTLLLCTKTIPGQGPTILYSTLHGERWSRPQTIPHLAPHTFNPEATGLPDGSIAVACQTFQGHAYGIGLRFFKDGQWSEDKPVCSPAKTGAGPIDCWDPILAHDAKSGKLLIAWVSYFAGEYDLCWSTYADGQVSSPGRIARAGYDLHPSALADPDGGVWLAWDSITIPNHGGSGGTYIKHPHQRDSSAMSQRQQFFVAAAHWQDGRLTAPGGQPRVSDPKENTRHGGSPRLGYDASGRLYIAYRTLHPPVSGRTLYFWDITTRTLDGATWTEPVRLAGSDGPTEEAVLAPAGRDAMLVFYQRDYRRTATGKDGNQVPRLANAKLVSFFDHHGDYGDPKTRHGDIHVTRVPGVGGKPQAGEALQPNPPAERELQQFKPYTKGPYTVLFGDLHRHSNVSRCSRGAEPDPDDHYRYSRDVCRYDFLGVSDHAAHTSDYNWWRLNKLADLYYTPGDFTTFFGVEWNGPEGHKNVMSPSRDLPLLATTGIAPSALRLWEELDKWGGPAITIPHTSSLPGQDCDWTKHNDKYQRLVEIFQGARGSFEGEGAPRMFRDATLKGQHVQDALAMKYRLGIICSTDHGYAASYCCVYAKENTREAVFDALYDRRTYGATEYGIIVDFNVNGVMMGRDVNRGDGVVASGYVRGAGKLDKVQILKDNAVVHEWTPAGDEQTIDWTDPDPGTGLHWYYLRVIQENDEMAWSSPAWVVD